MNDLHRILQEQSQDRHEEFGAETAKVATTANDPDDDVYVTLPNSESPDTRIEVVWRPGVQFIEGIAEPMYPTRGDRGIVVYTDTGEAWLIW